MNDDESKRAIPPWSVKGVDPEARETAKAAARAAGVTLGTWLNQAIAAQAGDISAAPGPADADDEEAADEGAAEAALTERLATLEQSLGAAMSTISGALQTLNLRLDALENGQPRQPPARPQAAAEADRNTTITRLFGRDDGPWQPPPREATPAADTVPPEAPPEPAAAAEAEPAAEPEPEPASAAAVAAPTADDRPMLDDYEDETVEGSGPVAAIIAWVVAALILVAIGGFLYYAFVIEPQRQQAMAPAAPAPSEPATPTAAAPATPPAEPSPAATPPSETPPAPAESAQRQPTPEPAPAAETEAGPPSVPPAAAEQAEPTLAPPPATAPAEPPAPAPAPQAAATDATSAPATTPPAAAPVDEVAELRQRAEDGSSSAAFALGNRYARGDGVPLDMGSAAQWYEQAAQAGLAPAQFNLGVLHEEGRGVAKDARQALLWYVAAAEQGHVEAQFRLGGLYGRGNGANRDYVQAAKWYRRAALQGHGDAQFNLGLLYDRGVGVQQSDTDAYYWLVRAAAAGDQEALQRQVSVGRRLAPDMRAELERRAAAGEPPPAPVAAAPTLAQPVAAVPPEASLPALTAAGEINPEAVRRAQLLLERLGYDPGPPDGLLGAKTVDAIREFRRREGLPGGGSFDDDLLASLAAAARLN